MAFDTRREAQQAHVHEEVDGATREAESGQDEASRVPTARPDREHGRGRERRQGHGADVVDDRVQRVAPGAPVDRRDRHGQRQRRPIVEERGARE